MYRTNKLKGALSFAPSYFIKTLVTSIILGIISFVSWNYFGFLFILYLIHLFRTIEENINNKKYLNLILDSLIILFSWHFGALFWMLDIDQGIYGLLCNMLLYLIPIFIYSFLRVKKKVSTFSIVPIFLIFEFILNYINFSYPWLTLGNLFSNQIYLIQWYEYTGVLGGSFWILVLSFILQKINYRTTITAICFLITPIIISLTIHNYRQDLLDITKPGKDIVVFNIDHVDENIINDKDELAFYISKHLKEKKAHDITLIPEYTFRGLDETELAKSLVFKYLKDPIKQGKTNMVVFGTTLNTVDNKIVNSGILLSKTSNSFEKKNKKKLVPLTEYLPKKISEILNKGSYDYNAIDDNSKILKKYKSMISICYEIFYSFFISDNSNGSNVILLLSSEKFLNYSYFGARQYNNIIKLRAIENRKPIIKATNYGESLIIDPYGTILEQKNKAFASYNLKSYTKVKTVYSKINKKYILIILSIVLLIDLIKKYEK